MKLDRNKIFSFMLASVFAIALAGCGGGGGTAQTPDGGGGTPTMPDPPLVAAQKKAAAAASMANQSYMSAMAAVNAVKDNKDSDMDSYDMAMAAAARAKTASDSAASLSRMAAGTDSATDAEKYAAQAQLRASDAAMALADARKYAGMVTAAKTAADNKAARLAANKVAMSKEMAIAAEAVQETDDGPGGADATTDHAIAISRDRDGTEVKITVDGAGDDDPKFMQAMDLGGGRTMHTRKMKADDDGNVVEEVMIVSTDIEAPTAVAFAKFEEMNGTMSQTLNARKDGKAVSEDDPADSRDLGIALDGTVDADAVVLGRVMSNAFRAGTAASLTFKADSADTTDKDEAFEGAGTLNGAMGTYRCAGTTDCTVTLDAKGKITAMSDGWIFTPGAGAMSDQPDYDYLHYGFWLKKTTDEDGVLTYNEVETFAGSSLAEATNATVEGTASYKGGATGVYVKNVYNTDRTLNTASSGHFTADVSIMAYFGGNDVAVSKQNTIEGTIDNFMLSVEGDDGSDWSVDLAASISGGVNLATGTAKGGGAGNGSISGTFYGDDSKDVGGTDTPIGHKALVGEFNAEFTDGSVAGAYGVRKQD